jgi:hypothetical protein
MKVKKSLLIKLGLVMSLLVVNVFVFAATPGSSCTIRARVVPILNLTIPGRVSSTGNTCFPTIGLPDILAPLRSGVACNVNDRVIGVIRVTVTCPN